MENQSDRNAEEPSANEPEAALSDSEEEGVVDRKSGFRRAFRFLGSWTFWWRLGVGALLLGAGVLIGLGIAWFIDDSKDSDYDEGRRGGVFTFRVDPSGEGFGEEGFPSQGERFDFPPQGFRLVPDGRFVPDPGDRRRRGPRMDEWWERKGEWFERKGPGSGEFFEEGGMYIPYEVLEILEGLAEQVEQFLESVATYLEEGGLGLGPDWPDEYDDRGLWEDDQEYSSGEWGGEDDRDSIEREGRFWDEDDDWPFAGLGFPFGEILPGLALLEDCELDFQGLSGIIEDLEDLDLEDLDLEALDLEDSDSEEEDEEGLEDGEDLEDFFRQIEELFEEACETPSDN